MTHKLPSLDEEQKNTRLDTGCVINEPSPSSHLPQTRFISKLILLVCLACTASLWTTYRRTVSVMSSTPPATKYIPIVPLRHLEDDSSQPADIDPQHDILSEHGFLVEVPEAGHCLGAKGTWEIGSAIDGSSRGTTDADPSHKHRTFRAYGRIDLRKGVRSVYVDTGFQRLGLDAILHIVSGPTVHAVLYIEAFYDEIGALAPIRACAYRTDFTKEVWLRNQPNPEDMDEVYPETEEEELLSYEDLLALRILQLPTEPAPGELQDIDLFRLQRSSLDTSSQAPVWFNITLVIPEEDNGYKVKVDVGDIIDVDVRGDVMLESLKVFNFGGSAEIPPPARGRLVAQQGFAAHKIEVNTRGVTGCFSADNYLRIHAGQMDAHVDAVRSMGYVPPSISLSTHKAPLNATVRLVDPEPERPGFFDINVFAQGGPLNLTIVESDPYSAVTIRANTEDGDARIKLDKRFEGYLNANVLEPYNGQEMDVHICLESKSQDSLDVEDPTGEGLQRNFEIMEVTPYEMTAEVAWGEKNWGLLGEGWSGASDVTVTSVRGSAYIEL